MSAFQEGFDDGAEACRDDFGTDRVLHPGRVLTRRDSPPAATPPYDDLLDIVDDALPRVLGARRSGRLGGDFDAADVEAVRRRRARVRRGPPISTWSTAPTRTLVAIDEPDLTRPLYDELGDFAVITAVAIPYGLDARDQLGLSTDDEDAIRSAVCLTGAYAARGLQRDRPATSVLISPGDIDESVLFLLTYGNDPDVLPDVDLTGFQLVDIFRTGFIRRACGACDVGACRRRSEERGGRAAGGRRRPAGRRRPTTANSSTRCVRAASRSSPAVRRTTSSSRSKAASTSPVPSRKSAARVCAATSSGAASAAASASGPASSARRNSCTWRSARPASGWSGSASRIALVGRLGGGEVAALQRRLGGVQPRVLGGTAVLGAAPGDRSPGGRRTSSVTNCRACSSGMAPVNSATSWPCQTALTAGMPCTRSALRQRRVGVDVDLGQHPGAAALGGQPLEHRRQLLARPAPLGPQVEHDRHLEGAVEHLGLEGRLGDVDDAPSPAHRPGRRRSGGGAACARAAASERALTAARSTAPAIAAAIWACWAWARGSGRPGRVGCMGT